MGHQVLFQSSTVVVQLTVNQLVVGSIPTSGANIMGDWYSWEHTSLARLSQEFESPILHQHESEL